MASEMTWLNYYQAVKRGDLHSVKNASDKDFRISLAMNKSAFELAALFGHLNLVEYFLQNSDKRKDFQLLSMVLKDGLRSGNLEISELLWNFIDGKSEMTGDFVMPAMDGRNLDCVKLVYDTPVKNRCTPQQYVAKAFEVGWCYGLKYVERAEDKEGVLIQTTMLGVSASQSMFVDLALNNMENVMKAVESPPSHRDWFRRRDYNVVSALATHKSTSRFMYWSVFELAAHFGHLDILKYLIEKVVRVNPAYYSLRKELRSAFKFALRNDQTHILEYLIEEGLVKPRPPFEYEGFKVNDAFLYLKEKTKHLSGTEGVEANVMECMKVLWPYEDSPSMKTAQAEWFKFELRERQKVFVDEGTKFWQEDRSASRLAKVDRFYDEVLDYMDPDYLNEDVGYYFMVALAHQNVDAAMSFRKRMCGSLTCTSLNFHELFSEAMCFGRLYGRRKRIGALNDHLIPSLVIVELLLGTLNEMKDGGETCSCRQLNPMALFLRTARSRVGAFNETEYEKDVHLPLAVLTRNAEAVMEVLVDNGASKPFPSVVREMTNSVFVADAPVSSVFAARLLAVLHCTRLRDRAQHLIKIDNLSPEPTDWFVKTWTNRDEFLTEILIAYGANGWRPYLEADCLLVYFARPKAKREHFIHCLNETGVEVRDRDLDRYFNHGRRIVGDSDDKRLSRVNKASYYENVFSLQSLTRLSIYNQCLKVASESSKYASVRNLVDSIAQSLPKPLADYLQFSDVYETLSLVNTSKMIINRKVLAIVNSRTYNIQHHRNALRVLGSDLSESEIENETNSEDEIESEDETDSDDDSSDDDDDSDETESEESDD